MSNPLKKVSKLLHHHKDKNEHTEHSSSSETPRDSISTEHKHGHADPTLTPSSTVDSRHSATPASPSSGTSTPTHHKSLVERILPIHKKASPASSVHEDHSHRDSEESEEKKRSKLEAKRAKAEKAKEEHDAVVARHDEAYQQDPLNTFYGEHPIIRRTEARPVHRDSIDSMADMKEGDKVVFRARIHHIRPKSAHLAFVVFRQRISTVQGVVAAREGQVSENMVRFIERLPRETTAVVHGTIQIPKSKEGQVKTATVHGVEVLVDQLWVVGTVTEPMGFHVEDVDRSLMHEDVATSNSKDVKESEAKGGVTINTRLENRLIDLRSDASQSIFRIQSAVGRFYRSYLDSQGFTEIHSSKFQGGGTESGSSVFKVDYFGRPAYLAQSPQLGKQMAIAADFNRVYEVGPVFRAENSNTHRHLTEFTGLDLEMAIEEDYHEVVSMLDNALKTIFRGLQSEMRREIDTVRKYYPSEDLVFPEKTVMLHFLDGVKLLNDSGWTENGKPIPEYEDFSTATERRLGQLVKEKYGTDYYILDKFPLDARPFYTMPDADDGRLSNSCDFFIRGEEILSGGQRIHNAPMLEKRMKEAGIDPSTMQDYLSGFRQGCPPHGGGGIGLERVVFLFLKLGNIRWASLYPKDPRSFPKVNLDKIDAVHAPAEGDSLRGPAKSTVEYTKAKAAGEHPEKLTLEDLVAAYGDSAATSWFDPFWETWQHPDTGAICGFACDSGYAICWGRPLCDDSQLPVVLKAFIQFLTHDKKMKPVFAVVDKATQEVLYQQFNWSCLIAAAEQRIDPRKIDVEQADKNVRAKVNRAKNAGVQVHAADAELSEEIKEKINKRMAEWKAARHGTQVYSAGLRPWDDPTHRRYFYATDKDGNICALVVLAQLAKQYGFQLKYSLDFPDAPGGTIEMILYEAIQNMGRAGVTSATFGGSAPPALVPVGKDWGIRIKLLSKTYSAIVKSFHLADRSGFREKFGAEGDGQYVCFPHNGMGLKGVEAIMHVLQAEK